MSKVTLECPECKRKFLWERAPLPVTDTFRIADAQISRSFYAECPNDHTRRYFS